MALEEPSHLRIYHEKQLRAATRFGIFQESTAQVANNIWRQIELIDYVAPGIYGQTRRDDLEALHRIWKGESNNKTEKLLFDLGERAIEAEDAFDAREIAKKAMRPPPLILPVNDGFTDGLNVYKALPQGFDMHESSPGIREAIVAALRKREVF